MITIRTETMSEAMTKFHLEGLPFPAVLHRFTEPDLGDPYDHPWSFRTFILKGGYREHLFSRRGRREITRLPGETFIVPAARIHRIVELLDGECWTLIMPLPGAAGTPGFYQYREDGIYHRFWHEEEFRKI